MQKYKQINVVHPEDVGVPRKIMSDSPMPEPSKVRNFEASFSMRPTALSVTAAISITVIIIVLLAYFVPIPRIIRMNVQGAEVDRVGNIIATGDFVLEARYNDYLLQKDTFELIELSLPNAEILSVSEMMNPPLVDNSLPTGDNTFYTYGGVVFGDPNGKPIPYPSGFLRICMPSNFSYIVIKAGDRLFVASIDEEPNYLDILIQCPFLFE